MLDTGRINEELLIPAAAPLYERLRNAIEQQILDNTLEVGEALPSERNIQETVDVSRTTVRQAIRALVDAGFIQSVPGTGNFVLAQNNLPSESQTSQSHKIVGIIADDSSLFLYYAQIASAFNYKIRDAGYMVDLALHNNNPDNFEDIINSFIEAGASAIAISPPTWFDISSAIQKLKTHGIHIVIVGRRANDPSVDYVGTDNVLIGYQATKHLLELGHTHIVHIGTPNYPTAQDRALGYIHAMQEAKLPPRIFPREVEVYMQSSTIPANLAGFMAQGTEPSQVWTEIVRQEITAAFCFNDETAIWLQKGLRNLNLEIPRDISVIGVDNLPFIFDAPLTTFELPGHMLGEQAADLLLRRIAGENFPPQPLKCPAKFIQRISTAPPKTRIMR